MAESKSYGDFRFEKFSVKETGKIAARGKHNERTRETPNADPDQLHENVRLAGSGDWLADVRARADEATFTRSNSVLAIDLVFYVSKGFFDDKPPALVDEWARRTMDWTARTFGGEKNVVAAILHKDELTPHVQAMVVPLDEKDRLNARAFIGQPRQIVALHTSYHEAVADLGLQRGVQGSVARHTEIRDWYVRMEGPTPAREEVLRAVEVEPPRRIVGNPERYASEQREQIVDRLAPVVDAALVKATHYEQQAAKAEANVTVLQGQVRDLQRERDTLREDYKALAAQVRAIPLESVIERLGGEQDRYNHAKYRLDGEHISITGERFYNHDRQQGGGGAIDLVMHATRYSYPEAVAYLRDTHGTDAAITAATWRAARQAHDDARHIVEHAERPPFRAPIQDEERWPQVRAYLIEERQLPATLVDDLHTRGMIYADHRANAVFLRQDAESQATGASLRGTAHGSDFKGLAAGTRRDEGHFSFTVGTPTAYRATQIYLAESPIDALSRAALVMRESATGERIFISTDGHGSLPTKAIDAGLERRAVVHCGFDRDRGGETLWERVTERYGAQAHETYGPIDRDRPPAGAKDWNVALQQAYQREDARTPSAELDHTHAPKEARARDDRADERR